jgi:hypothetical protein
MMRNSQDEELERALRAIDPAKEELAGWTESEVAKRAYARILHELEERPQTKPTRNKAIRLALVAAGALVVVVAIVVAVVFGTSEPAGQVVDSTTTSATPSTNTTMVAPADGVDQVAALAGVVRVAEAIRAGTGSELPEPPSTDPAGYVGRAESLGIILPSERDALLMPGSVTRGTYALWLWRVFSGLLPQVQKVDFADVDALSEDMQEAVLEVARAGILGGRASGRFEADQPLTVQEEQEALLRLEKALGLRE